MSLGQQQMEPQVGMEDVNYIHQGGQNRNFNNNYRPYQGGGNYQPNHSHPNLSYGNPNNAIHPPPGFSVSNGAVIEPKNTTPNDSTHDLLKAFMDRTEKLVENTNQRIDKVESTINTRMTLLETQVSQIAQVVGAIHRPGTFPSTTVPNPKDCKAIHVEYRNNYGNSIMAIETSEKQEIMVEHEEENERTKEPECHKTTPIVSKLPFPIYKAKKLDDKFAKFLEIFKKVHINIPLIEALQRMSGYVKFLKEVVSKKKRLTDYETVNLAENCSAIIQQKISKKEKDPGSFNISCVIGDDRQTKALCDLGASINLMPLSFFRKLKFGVLKPTTATLRMADGSTKHPNGLLENVLVKVNDFIFPVDFIVLDMKEDPNVPLILGRPFLATGKALIDVTKGELTLRHGNKSAIFGMFKKMKSYGIEEIKLVEDEPQNVVECKAIHVAHKVTLKDHKCKSSCEEIPIPKWIFDESGELPRCDESNEREIKTKNEVETLKFVAPESNDVKAPTKASWWKKRLTKLYFAALAKTKPKDIIRVRIES